MPFLIVLYLFNYLDRITLAVVGPNGMNDELNLSAAAFGFASGIFFAGYLLLEVPSNIALHRFGARKWIARIVFSWGVVASLTTFVPNAEALYALRILLGMAEAGFAPGVLLYLTYWFPRRVQAQAIATFAVAIPLSSVVGAPLMSWLVTSGDGWFGLPGWRVTILLTGLPAIVLGILCWFVLADRPASTSWLTSAERDLLEAEIAADQAVVQSQHRVRDALKNRSVWVLASVLFTILYGMYAIGFFLPTIIAGFQEQFAVSFSTVQVGFLTAIPYALAAGAMIMWARRADARRTVVVHAAAASALGSVGIGIAVVASSPLMAMVGVSLGAMGLLSALATFLAVPARMFTGVAAAACLGLVNTAGNLGSFVGPFATGWIRDLTGTTKAGLLLISAILIIGAAVLVLRFRELDRIATGDIRGGTREIVDSHSEPESPS
ncbi:MFS transporter [Pseudonocardia oroxyli]|uniref:Nitrate/nitrite transporter NarK n=1 Tax=Pseudonocardia oroxyli TaxID=366584 RepID=A0A1G8DXM7_PSEOR|nr:MFS transporter [Pseudonocardia oroxyli]SDH62189.1 Nitrate/nitrite transporter NarK [Pseudonocardia oroxyli]